MSMRVATKRPKNLILLEHAHERAQSVQNRIADAITGFAGSRGEVLGQHYILLEGLTRAAWR